MQENSIAIVGSRDADKDSLQFTDNIAKKASEQNKVVVSGFAKGVDKQSLDSAIRYKGRSIVVLPQGIMTFGSGIKKYYAEITNGNVLLVSTFHPKAAWSVGLAMARNSIIYGLANEIYVAQSSESGGTWAGVINGLKKGRSIFAYLSENTEKNNNLTLIEKGAKPVDIDGNFLEENLSKNLLTSDNINSKNIIENSEFEQLVILLKKETFTPKQILEKLPLNISDKNTLLYWTKRCHIVSHNLEQKHKYSFSGKLCLSCPFVELEEKMFLKTIIPSRKATRHYIGKEISWTILIVKK